MMRVFSFFGLEDARRRYRLRLERENAVNQHLYTLHSTPYTLHPTPRLVAYTNLRHTFART